MLNSAWLQRSALCVAVVSVACISRSSEATTIGSWGFEAFSNNDTAGPYVNEAAAVAGVTVGDMVPANLALGATKVRNNGDNRLYGASAAGAGDGLPGFSARVFDLRMEGAQTNAALAIANDSFLTFTVEASGANAISLTQLSMFAGVNGSTPGENSTVNVDIDVDGDGTFDDFYVFNDLTEAAGGNPGEQVDVALASMIAAGDTGTVRVLAFRALAATGSSKLRFDDLTIDASLVPEPNAIFITIVGSLVGFCLMRVRRV